MKFFIVICLIFAYFLSFAAIVNAEDGKSPAEEDKNPPQDVSSTPDPDKHYHEAHMLMNYLLNQG